MKQEENKRKTDKPKGKRRMTFFLAELVLTGSALVLFVLFRLRGDLAELFAVTIGAFFRRGLALLTGWFPFSLFEIILYTAVLYGLFALGLGVYVLIRFLKRKTVRKRWKRCLVAVPVVLATVFQLFVATLAPCYFRFTAARHMDLDTRGVDEDDVFFALRAVSGVINETAPLLEKNEAGETVGKSLAEVKGDVRRAADAFGSKHDFFQSKGSDVKFLLCSPVLTYTHISGIYGFFTGEANVNTNFPHFVVTATAAHETCHARGIAPENECNFLAAVILMESDDPYLRYCGAMAVFDELWSVCYKIDAGRTGEIIAGTDRTAALDLIAYSRFFEPYRENVAEKAATGANNTYLKSMGQKAGVASYSQIIQLIAAYYKAD